MLHIINHQMSNQGILTKSGNTFTLLHPDADTFKVGDQISQAAYNKVINQVSHLLTIKKINEVRLAKAGDGWKSKHPFWANVEMKYEEEIKEPVIM